jgi:hypothetical protein
MAVDGDIPILDSWIKEHQMIYGCWAITINIQFAPWDEGEFTQ